MSTISKAQVQAMVGRRVYIKLRDGSAVNGKLERFANERLYLRVQEEAGKVQIRAFIIPLALFSVLAIALTPFAGGFGGGCGPCGPGPYGPGGCSPCGPGPYGPGGPGPYGPGGPGPYGPYGPGGPGQFGPGYGGKGFY
ncbi:hypothetical protein [Paenibacillus herberti]|uniref:Uncharacterized protein n=1 Tax=Paenibacillus herberti TaxID=1619309 RepID=A0A229P5V4_9BACL|nr:hypothetical protein [Paenibacillus herberti]OXM17239.1 hypothetical protein CGZ75_11705 [Paenibacillus herberti]